MAVDPTIPCVEGFWQFVQLRNEAFTLKANGLKSPDPVLGSGHFPNCYREMDPGTLYFHNTVGIDLLTRSIVYRLVNRRQTFQDFGGIPHRHELVGFAVFLSTRMSRGQPVFTHRHQTISLRKYLTTLEYLASSLWHPSVFIDLRIDLLWKRLKDNVPGISNFFAWQVCCDMMEATEYDENEWAYMGPGPQGALQMIFEGRVTQAVALDVARKLQLNQPELRFGLLTLKNVEHSLCEYFRYTRAHWAR